MACQDIDTMRRQVCDRLRGTVTGWQWDLQAKYGDPRVYEQQQAEMNRVDAEVQHDLSRRTSALLEDAYEKQRSKNRETHTQRMAKHRAALKAPSRSRATRQGSAAGASRTPPPPAGPPPGSQ